MDDSTFKSDLVEDSIVDANQLLGAGEMMSVVRHKYDIAMSPEAKPQEIETSRDVQRDEVMAIPETPLEDAIGGAFSLAVDRRKHRADWHMPRYTAKDAQGNVYSITSNKSVYERTAVQHVRRLNADDLPVSERYYVRHTLLAPYIPEYTAITTTEPAPKGVEPVRHQVVVKKSNEREGYIILDPTENPYGPGHEGDSQRIMGQRLSIKFEIAPDGSRQLVGLPEVEQRDPEGMRIVHDALQVASFVSQKPERFSVNNSKVARVILPGQKRVEDATKASQVQQKLRAIVQGAAQRLRPMPTPVQ